MKKHVLALQTRQKLSHAMGTIKNVNKLAAMAAMGKQFLIQTKL
jgi:hypothetical protein